MPPFYPAQGGGAASPVRNVRGPLLEESPFGLSNLVKTVTVFPLRRCAGVLSAVCRSDIFLLELPILPVFLGGAGRFRLRVSGTFLRIRPDKLGSPLIWDLHSAALARLPALRFP